MAVPPTAGSGRRISPRGRVLWTRRLRLGWRGQVPGRRVLRLGEPAEREGCEEHDHDAEPVVEAKPSISLGAAAVASPLQVVVGDWAARDVAQAQPSWPRSRGSRPPPAGPPSTCWAGTTATPWCTGSRSRGCCPCSPSTTPTPRLRVWISSRWPTSRRSTWSGSPSRPWSKDWVGPAARIPVPRDMKPFTCDPRRGG